MQLVEPESVAGSIGTSTAVAVTGVAAQQSTADMANASTERYVAYAIAITSVVHYLRIATP
jgi:hypothetical protein